MDFFEEKKKLFETRDFLKQKVFKGETPEVAVVLGSGLQEFGDRLDGSIKVGYEEILHFPTSSVVGHQGRLVFGKIGKKSVVVMQGRVHFYEGYGIREVVFPLRSLILSGVKTVILTNSAGGINRKFKPGDFMIIRDHINLMGENPLIGRNFDFLGPRFPDMSNAYSVKIIKKAEEILQKMGVSYHKGVYCGLRGPSYETPAEVRMLEILGADAVGMSTVPEVIAAVHAGCEVFGLSVISNVAAGLLKSSKASENSDEEEFVKLDHSEVTKTAKMVASSLVSFLFELVRAL